MVGLGGQAGMLLELQWIASSAHGSSHGYFAGDS